MSTVPFKNIPGNLRVPLFYGEVSNSNANTGQLTSRALIIGQAIAGNPGALGAPVLSGGVNDAIAQYGEGSMIARQVAAYRAADEFGELWLLPLADAGGATAAVGSINCTAAATANGTISLYIAARKGDSAISLPVTSTMTAAQVATALAAAINAAPNLPVSAAVDGVTTSKVNITALNAGLSGNSIDIRVNYYGATSGEALPAGLALTIVQPTGGATNPVISTALANIATQAYSQIVQPYTDATSITAMASYLNDTTGTWSWETQLYGHAFTAYRNSFANIVTKTTALNDQHLSVLGFFDSPTWEPEVAADFAATAAVSLRADPGLPLQTLVLSTMLAPPPASRFPLSERNTLLFDGCSTFRVNDDGSVALENVITTYQLNGFGQADDSYLEIETMFLLAFILQTLAGVVTSRYARVKLAADGTVFAAGSAVVTPSVIKGDLIAEYQDLEFNGYVQNSAAFAAGLIVQLNATNPNRVDVLWPGTLIDQLRIFALLAQFRLQ